MIRRKEPDLRLFYASEELYRSPRTGFYARLNAAVGNWGELCKPLEGAFYEGKNGRPVDPVVYFKIFLVGYLENLVFDTDLAERIGDSLSLREFVGYGPTEPTPDHSSLSRVREAMGRDGLLERVMEKGVALCVSAGLVEGSEAAADSTLLAANASLSSLKSVKTGEGVREHLARLREEGKPLSVKSDEFRAPGDPHARIAKKGSTCPRGMYHKATLVVDSKSQVILSAGVRTADVADPEAALLPLASAQAVLAAHGKELKTAVFDAGYDDSDFHAAVEALGVAPVTNYCDERSAKAEGLAKKDFVYDEGQDVYVCPNGKELARSGRSADGIQYRSKKLDCESCPLQSACLGKETKRRTVTRTKNEAARERNIARCHTDEGRAALRRRKTVVEPPLGHMKRFGGMRLVNCRGEKRVRTKTFVAALGWNLLKLARKISQDLLLALLGALSTRFSALKAAGARV
ncbi:MAG: transposase [Fimbriimonas sp.]